MAVKGMREGTLEMQGGLKVDPVAPLATDFEQLVTRVWKGILIGADDATIRTQCEGEGIDPHQITYALKKAHRLHDARQEHHG